MADYAKRTNKELSELLAARGLQTSGKKAELVSRLEASDRDQEAPGSNGENSHVANARFVIPRLTRSLAQIDSSSTNTAAHPQSPSEAQQQSAPDSQPTAPSAPPTHDTAEQSPQTQQQEKSTTDQSNDAALATQASYSLQLPTSTVDEELRKRKARAARFGTTQAAPPAAAPSSDDPATTTATNGAPTAPSTDTDALKALERAKRFGLPATADASSTPSATDNTGMSKLDSALSEEKSSSIPRKRGGEPNDAANDAFEDPALRKRRFPIGGGRGGRGPGRRNVTGPGAGARPTGVSKSGGAGGGAVFSNDGDRAAADARKKRWG